MPFKKGEGGRQKGVLNKATRDIKAFAQDWLTDPAYLESLRIRLLNGEAPHIETLLYHYGYGKPKETLALEGPMRPVIVDLLRPEDIRRDHDDE